MLITQKQRNAKIKDAAITDIEENLNNIIWSQNKILTLLWSWVFKDNDQFVLSE